FIGDFFRTVRDHVPPPAGLASPFAWGTEAGITTLFGTRVRVAAAERKDHVFRYESVRHFIDIFRDYYGPTFKAFEALDEDGRRALEDDLAAMLARRDPNGGRGPLAIPGEYLELVLENRS